jgi:hypothetical protein
MTVVSCSTVDDQVYDSETPVVADIAFTVSKEARPTTRMSAAVVQEEGQEYRGIEMRHIVPFAIGEAAKVTTSDVPKAFQVYGNGEKPVASREYYYYDNCSLMPGVNAFLCYGRAPQTYSDKHENGSLLETFPVDMLPKNFRFSLESIVDGNSTANSTANSLASYMTAIANVEGNLSVEVEFECAGDYMTATIGSNGFATFCSMEALDFSEVEDVRAYTVSTYQPKTGEVTLTRVYEVPAGMGLVLIGKEGEYEIPLGTGKAMVSNLLVGINENTTLNATEEDHTNFILPEDQEKAAFCAVTDEVELPFSKAYLPLPTESVAHLEDGKLTLHLADPSLGDVDGDGYVNISDVTTLVNIILGK